MSDKAPAWVVPVMRVGYAARGVVYVIVGGIALASAWNGGQAEGAKGAIASMRDTTFGEVLLWAVAAGLLAYTVWRGLAAALDLDCHGHDAKGIIARAGQAMSAVIHLSLAIFAAGVALGGSSGGGDSGMEDWTAKLMSMPFGQWLVVIVGLIVIGAGGYYAWKGYSEKYRERLRATEWMEEMSPICKFGLIAHGAAIALIGAFFVYAGWTADPSEAGGLGQAFQTVRSAAFGRILLGILALGMVAFGGQCFVQAVYRIVPRRTGSGVMTLARSAKLKAQAQMS